MFDMAAGQTLDCELAVGKCRIVSNMPHSRSDTSTWHPSDVDPIFSGDSAQKYVSAAEALANAVALALWHCHCHTENWILRVSRVESDSMVAAQASEE